MKHKGNILVIEDEAVVASATEKVLTAEGLNVDHAADGEVALTKLANDSYRLVLCDLMLPKIGGLELIGTIKKQHPTLPTVVITGYVTLDNAVKSFKLGAFDFLPKPFDFEELLGVVFRGLNSGSRDSGRESPAPPEPAAGWHALGDHAFVHLESEETALVMVGPTFPNLLGEIREVQLPEVDAEVLQGNACATIISQPDWIHRVWAPLSGRVIETNQRLLSNFELLNRSPWQDGWLLRLHLTGSESELENLTSLQES